MNSIIPSLQLIQDITRAEIDYMIDRMRAIEERPGNPEGVEIRQIGHAWCFASRTMPWPSFNTVKGLTAADAEKLDQIIEFYKARGRKAQFEIVPSLSDQSLLQSLAERGYYQSGFHTSLYMEPSAIHLRVTDQRVRIAELEEDQFATYAAIHCRGTGLPDSGIPPVAANNKVLYARAGWKFYIAYVDEAPAAVGVMYIQDDLASLTFAATLPEYRNLGLQQMLLIRRIQEAKLRGCRLAISQCAYLSSSHRNMERVGMKIGYTRTTWTERATSSKTGGI